VVTVGAGAPLRRRHRGARSLQGTRARAEQDGSKDEEGRELLFSIPMSDQEVFHLVEEKVYRIESGATAPRAEEAKILVYSS
jgi:hypothetical protein